MRHLISTNEETPRSRTRRQAVIVHLLDTCSCSEQNGSEAWDKNCGPRRFLRRQKGVQLLPLKHSRHFWKLLCYRCQASSFQLLRKHTQLSFVWEASKLPSRAIEGSKEMKESIKVTLSPRQLNLHADSSTGIMNDSFVTGAFKRHCMLQLHVKLQQ